MAKPIKLAPCKTCGRKSTHAAKDARGLCLSCLLLPEPLGAQIVLLPLPDAPPVKRERVRAASVKRAPVEMPMLPFEAKAKRGRA